MFYQGTQILNFLPFIQFKIRLYLKIIRQFPIETNPILVSSYISFYYPF